MYPVKCYFKKTKPIRVTVSLNGVEVIIEVNTGATVSILSESTYNQLCEASIQICGDCKLTVNHLAKLDTYLLPKVDDLLATLAGGSPLRSWT